LTNAAILVGSGVVVGMYPQEVTGFARDMAVSVARQFFVAGAARFAG
jgi:hypothetical protein